jgi:hypothetical protein
MSAELFADEAGQEVLRRLDGIEARLERGGPAMKDDERWLALLLRKALAELVRVTLVEARLRDQVRNLEQGQGLLALTVPREVAS